MKKFKYFAFAILSIGLIGFSSCNNDDPVTETPTDPFENLTLIGETEAVGAGAIVKIYADEALFVGYNNIYVAVYDSANQNTQITDGHVTFMPMMDMPSGMSHTCPFEDPSHAVEEGTKAFKGAVTFVMPSTAGTWTLNVHVHNHTNMQNGVASLPITVVQPSEAKLISFTSDFDGAQLFVARITPTDPEVGVNDIQLGIWKKESMMNWPAVDDIVINMEPEMPSMGHGSPNNVDPMSTGNGKYDGAVNFTMTGYWKINLDFFTATNDTIKTDQFFDVTFQ